ncbi:E3 31.4 kDa [simian adenovirus 22]|uniref:E3 31.4 kDa n=1 Tax=simian adenovirus 22 TaxID=175569 RepID=Q6QPG5_9ADEN|nr:E3 31.4 kDa [Simian adenovirus E22]
MKAVSTLVFCSLIGTVFSVSFLKQINVTEGENVTLVGVEGAQNTTWTKFHLDGWKEICTWNVSTYTCEGVNLTIVNVSQIQKGWIKGQSVSVSNSGYYTQHTLIYDIIVIPLPTPSPPSTTTQTTHTTQTTTYSTSNQPTTTTTAEVASSSGVRVAFLMLAPSSSPTASTNEQTTEFLSTVESHTTATSSAFSSTANLSSLSSTPISPATTPTPAILPTPLKQTDGDMQWQITLLIVIGLVILAVLLYYIFCRRIPNAHRKPAYKPIVVGQPEPLQVEGGLRNLLFSFTVW